MEDLFLIIQWEKYQLYSFWFYLLFLPFTMFSRGKYVILCVFVIFTLCHVVANSACTSNKQQNWENKTTTILFHKRPSQGCTEWHCGHADANYVVIIFSWFCTLLPVSCPHVGHTKKCTWTKSGKTRQRFVFFTKGLQ